MPASDASAILGLPYLQPSQAQKHVTHNEALRLLDVVVQLGVEDASLALPPGAPVQGQRWIVPPDATGAWAGQGGRVAAWIDGAWMLIAPRDGWMAWDRAGGRALVHREGAGWEPLVAPAGEMTDAAFTLVDDADATRRLRFQLGSVPAATTRVLTPPAADGALAILNNLPQTFQGPTSFSNPAVNVGTATTAATYGVGIGATAAGATKAVNVGTNGAAGSTTVVSLGSAAGGSLVVNSPLVQFGAGAVAAPQAALTAAQVGIGGAVPDAANRLSVNAPATLLNGGGGGHEVTVNKGDAGDDAALAFKTGFSARALMGCLGGDDFRLKVSATGAGYADALVVDRLTGRVELPAPLVLPALATTPAAPAPGRLALHARSRAGQPFAEVATPGARAYPLQPHLGLARAASWTPSTGAAIGAEGLAVATVGTVTTPTLAGGSLAASMRRWRVASAATVDAVAENRSAGWACWRGTAAHLGGFTAIMRVSLVILQPTGMGFFGLLGSTAALPGTTALAGLVNALGFGFQRGAHATWRLAHNDASGAPTLIDLGPGFPVVAGGVLTVHLAAAPGAATAWARAVNDDTGAVFEAEVAADLPPPAQFLAPRLHLGNGATAASAAFDSSGLYVETDY